MQPCKFAPFGAFATAAGQAVASPVAMEDASYRVLGRLFPDPLAGCKAAGAPVCSPTAQGNVPAHQFIARARAAWRLTRSRAPTPCG